MASERADGARVRVGQGVRAVDTEVLVLEAEAHKRAEIAPAIVFARVERTEPVRRPVVVIVGDGRIEVFPDTDEEALSMAVHALRSVR